MINRDDKIELTLSQIDFCGRNIDGFVKNKWQASLAGRAGSDRTFLRISPVDRENVSWVLIVWDSHDKDWDRFIKINRGVARSLNILPEIYATDEKHGLILEEDCGQLTLKDICYSNSDPGVISKKYQKVLDVLMKWQDIDLGGCKEISSRTLDKEVFLWETDYFAAQCVSEYFGLDSLINPGWEKERIRLAAEVSNLPLVCLHRDFQSENILIKGEEIKLVDYQGARLGAAEYDIASLLFDPYVSVLDNKMRYQLLDYYIKRSGRPVSHHTFKIAALQRLCQALGAYGNLSLHKGKEHYREYIPVALALLKEITEKEDNYPCLKKIIQECSNSSRHAQER